MILLEPKRSYASEAEDLVADRLLRVNFGYSAADCAGSYIDIGAHHPVNVSNTYYFYECGWRGVNVEPNSEAIPAFELLRPEDTTVNAAIADRSGSAEYHYFNDSQLNGIYDRSTVKHIEGCGYTYIHSRAVPCLSVPDFLAQYVPQPVDLLSLDIETQELSVLSAWDWEGKRPKIVCVEIHSCSIPQMLETPVALLLQQVGYSAQGRVWHSSFFVDQRR